MSINRPTITPRSTTGVTLIFGDQSPKEVA